MTMICPVQGAEVPDDDDSSLINQSEQKVFLILPVRRLRFTRHTVTGYSTSHAGAIGWIHGGHRLRDPGRVAHATLIDSPHTKDVGTTLHQAGDGEPGKLHRCVIALDPVVGSNLTSVDSKCSHILTVRSDFGTDAFLSS